ncbi:hypothetical protein SmJEL517_g04051 [Synchytrium microbalum]|uniref:Kinesin-associated protein 3 n=1 Tax=Synchytrium microbalum TaxID=1806994 RepID=A0A507BTJ9_9FUNG|nr:uncharacterized protein SmJEL517_g04051 [Synchytrium microbalum]TPX32870.1 hypothetical protein SmJEL517_g04051 [Synchytrium microbalum]
MADENDRNVLKKKVTAGQLYPHPTDNAIIVTYFVQLTLRGDNGQPETQERKERQKIIPIPNLDSSVSALASEMLSSCKLIPSNKRDALESIILELQNRPPALPDKSLQRRSSQLRSNDPMSPPSLTSPTSPYQEQATLDRVDDYIELLYEEMQDKIRAARLILQLTQNRQSLEALVLNESLMSALARVLREEARKSTDLTTSIISIFYAISNIANFHPVLTQHKVGDACLRVVDQEVARCSLWREELGVLRAKASKNPRLASELEQEQKRHETLIRKQDQLLFASVHLLLNMAEDPTIEVKMVRRGIIPHLTFLVDRNMATASTSPALPMLSLNFLKKLSVYRENKDALVQSGSELVSKLEKLLTYAHQGLTTLSLRLLLNLSHDGNFRQVLANPNMLTCLMKLSADRNHAQNSMQLMYQISIDMPARNLFSGQETVRSIMKQMLESRGERIPIELAAVACNMATHRPCAEIFVGDGGLRFLMRRAIKTRDSFLMKVVRNLAVCGGQHLQTAFLEFVDDLCHTLFRSSPPTSDFFVEALGTLSALSIPSFDYVKLCETYNLLDMIIPRLTTSARNRSHGDNDDDIALEYVCLVGSMAADDDFVAVAEQRGLLAVLMDLMIAKEDDDEMVLQIIYAIYHFLLHPSSRTVLLQRTQLVSYLIDLLYDRNASIRKMCDVCLDIIGETDAEWSARIRRQRFRHHNAAWLRCVTESSSHFRPMSASQSSDILGASSRLVYSAGVLGSASVRQSSPPRQQDYYQDEQDEEEDDYYGRPQPVWDYSHIGGSQALLDGPDFDL